MSAICPNCKCELRLVVDGDGGSKKSAASPPADASEVGELLDAIDINRIEGMSADFVKDMRVRFRKYGPERIKISEKQLAWLKKLAGADDDGF